MASSARTTMLTTSQMTGTSTSQSGPSTGTQVSTPGKILRTSIKELNIGREIGFPQQIPQQMPQQVQPNSRFNMFKPVLLTSRPSVGAANVSQPLEQVGQPQVGQPQQANVMVQLAENNSGLDNKRGALSVDQPVTAQHPGTTQQPTYTPQQIGKKGVQAVSLLSPLPPFGGGFKPDENRTRIGLPIGTGVGTIAVRDISSREPSARQPPTQTQELSGRQVSAQEQNSMREASAKSGIEHDTSIYGHRHSQLTNPDRNSANVIMAVTPTRVATLSNNNQPLSNPTVTNPNNVMNSQIGQSGNLSNAVSAANVSISGSRATIKSNAFANIYEQVTREKQLTNPQGNLLSTNPKIKGLEFDRISVLHEQQSQHYSQMMTKKREPSFVEMICFPPNGGGIGSNIGQIGSTIGSKRIITEGGPILTTENLKQVSADTRNKENIDVNQLQEVSQRHNPKLAKTEDTINLEDRTPQAQNNSSNANRRGWSASKILERPRHSELGGGARGLGGGVARNLNTCFLGSTSVIHPPGLNQQQAPAMDVQHPISGLTPQLSGRVGHRSITPKMGLPIARNQHNLQVSQQQLGQQQFDQPFLMQQEPNVTMNQQQLSELNQFSQAAAVQQMQNNIQQDLIANQQAQQQQQQPSSNPDDNMSLSIPPSSVQQSLRDAETLHENRISDRGVAVEREATILRYKKEVKELRAKEKRLEEKINKLTEDISNANERSGILEKRNTGLEARNASLVQQIANLQKENARFVEKERDHLKMLNHIQNERKMWDHQVRQTKDRDTVREKELRDREKKLSKKSEELQNQEKALQENLQRLEKQMDKLEKNESQMDKLEKNEEGRFREMPSQAYFTPAHRIRKNPVTSANLPKPRSCINKKEEEENPSAGSKKQSLPKIVSSMIQELLENPQSMEPQDFLAKMDSLLASTETRLIPHINDNIYTDVLADSLKEVDAVSVKDSPSNPNVQKSDSTNPNPKESNLPKRPRVKSKAPLTTNNGTSIPAGAGNILSKAKKSAAESSLQSMNSGGGESMTHSESMRSIGSAIRSSSKQDVRFALIREAQKEVDKRMQELNKLTNHLQSKMSSCNADNDITLGEPIPENSRRRDSLNRDSTKRDSLKNLLKTSPSRDSAVLERNSIGGGGVNRSNSRSGLDRDASAASGGNRSVVSIASSNTTTQAVLKKMPGVRSGSKETKDGVKKKRAKTADTEIEKQVPVTVTATIVKADKQLTRKAIREKSSSKESKDKDTAEKSGSSKIASEKPTKEKSASASEVATDKVADKKVEKVSDSKKSKAGEKSAVEKPAVEKANKKIPDNSKKFSANSKKSSDGKETKTKKRTKSKDSEIGSSIVANSEVAVPSSEVGVSGQPAGTLTGATSGTTGTIMPGTIETLLLPGPVPGPIPGPIPVSVPGPVPSSQGIVGNNFIPTAPLTTEELLQRAQEAIPNYQKFKDIPSCSDVTCDFHSTPHGIGNLIDHNSPDIVGQPVMIPQQGTPQQGDILGQALGEGGEDSRLPTMDLHCATAMPTMDLHAENAMVTTSQDTLNPSFPASLGKSEVDAINVTHPNMKLQEMLHAKYADQVTYCEENNVVMHPENDVVINPGEIVMTNESISNPENDMLMQVQDDIVAMEPIAAMQPSDVVPSSMLQPLIGQAPNVPGSTMLQPSPNSPGVQLMDARSYPASYAEEREETVIAVPRSRSKTPVGVPVSSLENQQYMNVGGVQVPIVEGIIPAPMQAPVERQGSADKANTQNMILKDETFGVDLDITVPNAQLNHTERAKMEAAKNEELVTEQKSTEPKASELQIEPRVSETARSEERTSEKQPLNDIEELPLKNGSDKKVGTKETPTIPTSSPKTPNRNKKKRKQSKKTGNAKVYTGGANGVTTTQTVNPPVANTATAANPTSNLNTSIGSNRNSFKGIDEESLSGKHNQEDKPGGQSEPLTGKEVLRAELADFKSEDQSAPTVDVFEHTVNLQYNPADQDSIFPEDSCSNAPYRGSPFDSGNPMAPRYGGLRDNNGYGRVNSAANLTIEMPVTPMFMKVLAKRTSSGDDN